MMKKLLFFALLAFLISSCGTTNIDPNTGGKLTEHNLLGNPSKATKEIANTDDYLLEKKQYVMSYNNTFGRANWVSWRCASEWIGNTQRQDNFRSDDELPSAFYRPGTQSFTGTGFDRGHLCPSADRTANTTDNSSTFTMSNMIAQAPNVNQMNWADLEDYCRALVKKGNELYIIAGAYGEGGSGSNGGTTKKIDNGRIRVPSNCWKIVVILPEGNDDVSRIDEKTRVIAIDIPNKQSSGAASWGTFRVSVRDIEAATSYDFLSQVPKSIQDIIEKTVDKGPTQ
jgi:endonuclease G